MVFLELRRDSRVTTGNSGCLLCWPRLNKVPNGVLHEGVKEEIEKYNLDLIGIVPLDEMIYEYDSTGKPLVNLPEDSKAKMAIKDIVGKLELVEA